MNKLSVVIPSFNEEANIKNGCLEEVWNYLNNQKYSWEIIVVDDASIDDTLKLCNKFAETHKGVRVYAEPHRGKGGSVIAGMLKTTGDTVVFTDMDQATPMEEFGKFLPKFEEGYDIVIGSRTGRKGAPLTRKLMAYGFSILRTIILRLPYKDTQCGFKAFRKEASEKIFKRMKVFSERNMQKGAGVTAGFDLEVLYLARKLGFRVAEVSVNWHHKGTERINPIKDSLEGLRDLLKVRLNAVTGKYRV